MFCFISDWFQSLFIPSNIAKSLLCYMFVLLCFVFPLILQVFLEKKSYSLKSLWCFLPNFIISFLLLILFKIILFKVIACQLFPVTPGQFFYCQMVVMMQNRTLGCYSKCIWGILLLKCFVHSFFDLKLQRTTSETHLPVVVMPYLPER